MMAMTFLLILLGGIVVLGGIGVAVAMLVAGSRNKGPGQITAMPGQVVGAREITAGGGVQHWITFRLSDGRELELQATPSQAYVVYNGQSGMVHYAGDKLTGWVPELAGGPKDSHSSE